MGVQQPGFKYIVLQLTDKQTNNVLLNFFTRVTMIDISISKSIKCQPRINQVTLITRIDRQSRVSDFSTLLSMLITLKEFVECILYRVFFFRKDVGM